MCNNISKQGTHNTHGSNECCSISAFLFWQNFGYQCNACTKFTCKPEPRNKSKHCILSNVCYKAIPDVCNGVDQNSTKQYRQPSFFITHNSPNYSSDQHSGHLQV